MEFRKRFYILMLANQVDSQVLDEYFSSYPLLCKVVIMSFTFCFVGKDTFLNTVIFYGTQSKECKKPAGAGTGGPFPV